MHVLVLHYTGRKCVSVYHCWKWEKAPGTFVSVMPRMNIETVSNIQSQYVMKNGNGQTRGKAGIMAQWASATFSSMFVYKIIMLRFVIIISHKTFPSASSSICTVQRHSRSYYYHYTISLYRIYMNPFADKFIGFMSHIHCSLNQV